LFDPEFDRLPPPPPPPPRNPPFPVPEPPPVAGTSTFVSTCTFGWSKSMLSLERVCALFLSFPSSCSRHFPKKGEEDTEEDERCEDRPRHLEWSLLSLEKSETRDASPLTVFSNARGSPTWKGRAREAITEDENALFVGARTPKRIWRSCARQRGKAVTRLCPLLCRENASSTPRRIVVLLKRRKVFEQVTYELGFKVWEVNPRDVYERVREKARA